MGAAPGAQLRHIPHCLNANETLAGYEGEHESLAALGWRVQAWSARGGYASLAGNDSPGANRHRERLWFSPHCLGPAGGKQGALGAAE